MHVKMVDDDIHLCKNNKFFYFLINAFNHYQKLGLSENRNTCYRHRFSNHAVMYYTCIIYRNLERFIVANDAVCPSWLQKCRRELRSSKWIKMSPTNNLACTILIEIGKDFSVNQSGNPFIAMNITCRVAFSFWSIYRMVTRTIYGNYRSRVRKDYLKYSSLN